jgi:hypothetical protein
MAVSTGQDAEHFEAADHLLDDRALLCQQAKGAPLLGSELPARRLATGRRAQGVHVLHALIVACRLLAPAAPRPSM